MRKPLRVLCCCMLMGIFGLVLFTACGTPPGQEQAQAGEGITFTDDSGIEVQLPAKPERISCLSGICIDILAALEIEPVSVVGPLGEDERYFGEPARNFPQIGGGFGEENLEDVANSDPDLVIGLSGTHDGLREGLKSIAPLYLMGPGSYQDSMNLLKEVGRLTGHENQAEQAINAFQTKLEHYRSESPGDRSALVMTGSGPDFGIETDRGLIGSLFAEVTSYPWSPSNPNAESGHAGGFEAYTIEKVLQVDPDVIFVNSFVFGNSQPLSEQFAGSPVWRELKAVKTGQVYEMNTEIWATGRGTITLGTILDEGMPKLYPDIFKE